MGKLTHTVSGSIASFKSPDKSPIESLKVHFTPIQEGTGDPSLTNVRPVTGWTGFNGYHGKNIYNIEDNTLDVYVSSSGAVTQNAQWQLTDYISVSGHESVVYCGITTPGTAPYSAWYNSEKQLISTFKQQTGQNTLSVPSGAAYVRFSILRQPTIDVDDVSNFMIFYADELRTFHVSWSDDYGTVYGGYVDLVTGNVVAEYSRLNVSDITFTLTSTYSGGFGFAKERLTGTPVYSNIFTMKPNNTTAVDQLGLTEILYHPNSTSNYKNFFYAYNSEYTDISDFSAWFKETYADGYFIYALETPTVIATLTPMELKAFIGQNHIWSNANGNVDCTYSLQDHLLKKRRTMANYHKLSTSGDLVADFNTTIKGGVLHSCGFYFSPTQSGTGDPSPTNVRAINGWRGFDLIRSGKNLLNKNECINNRVWWEGSKNYLANPNCASPLIPVKPGATYYRKGSSGSQGYVSLFDKDKTYISQIIWSDNDSKKIPDDTYYVGMTFDMDGINDYMVCLNTTDKTTYEPFVEIDEDYHTISLPDAPMGKNLLNLAFKNFKDTQDVQTWGRDADTALPNGDLRLPAGTYTLSITGCPSERLPTQWKVVDEDSNVLYNTYNGTTSISFTLTSEKAIYILISVPGTADEYKEASHYALHNQVMLEKGTTATPFEPYTNEFPGGYVDVTTGAVYKTYDKKILYGDLTLYMSNSYIKSNACDAYFSLNGVVAYSTRDIFCNMLKPSTGTWWQTAAPNTCCCNAAQFHMNISNDLLGVTDYTQETQSTVKAKINNYLSGLYNNGTPMVVAYQLATPQYIGTISPAKLKTLCGRNNIWVHDNCSSNIYATYWTK